MHCSAFLVGGLKRAPQIFFLIFFVWVVLFGHNYGPVKQKKTHQNVSCKVRKSTSICAIDLAVQHIHHHIHFTFSELEQRGGRGNGLESSQDPKWTSCDIVTQVTSPRRHTHSNFDTGTTMMVIILKMLMDGTMMIIKVTEGVTEKD